MGLSHRKEGGDPGNFWSLAKTAAMLWAFFSGIEAIQNAYYWFRDSHEALPALTLHFNGP